MSRGKAVRVGLARWYSEQNSLNAAGSAPNNDANGIAIPGAWKCETAHFATSKGNVADFDIYGQALCGAVNIWYKFDEVSFSGTGAEAEKLTGVSGFARLAAVRTDANVSNKGCNTWFGFSEA